MANQIIPPNVDRTKLEERFWAKVDKTPGHGPNGDCWLWTGLLAPKFGHGRFAISHDRGTFAHRLAYELAVNPIPEGLQVNHRCHVPDCVNPDHLYAGTQADNMRDKVRAGRQATGDRSGRRTHPERFARGEYNSRATLTAPQVLDMRRRFAAGESQVRLAQDFGTSKYNVWRIVHNKNWRHVTEDSPNTPMPDTERRKERQVQSLSERFWSKVLIPEDKTTCWLWQAAITKPGYGKFSPTHSSTIAAHRVAYSLAKGDIPDGKLIRHLCHVRACVNPAHLELGDPIDNSLDMVRAGRQAKGLRNGKYTHPERTPRGARSGSHTHPEKRPRGSRHGNAKLNETWVAEIRLKHKNGAPYRTLSFEYGVHHSIIADVVKRRTWKHVL